MTVLTVGMPASVGAQLRVEAFPSSVTASGHPMSVWVTVHNEGDAAVTLELRAVEAWDEGEVFRPLVVSGLEIDERRIDGPSFVVPARSSVRLVVFAHGFVGRPRSGYRARVTVCPTGASATPCARGETHITRAYRDPIRR